MRMRKMLSSWMSCASLVAWIVVSMLGAHALPAKAMAKGDPVKRDSRSRDRFFQGPSPVRALRSVNADDPEAIKVALEVDDSGLRGYVGLAMRVYDRLIEELPDYGIAVDLKAPIKLRVEVSFLESQHLRSLDIDFVITVEIIKNDEVITEFERFNCGNCLHADVQERMVERMGELADLIKQVAAIPNKGAEPVANLSTVPIVEPQVLAPPADPSKEEEPSAERPTRKLLIGGLISLGVGSAALAAGLGLRARGVAKERRSDDDQHFKRIDWPQLGNALIGVGGVAVGVGAILATIWTVRQRRERQLSTQPWIGQDRAGLTLQVRF